jgi:Cys-tRNA(Pro)/Cys-tRNA(Cys) deacylase
MKTNAARFLESLSIPFELREYEVDENDLSAIAVAKKIGMPAEQVFKTLLTIGAPSSRGPQEAVFASWGGSDRSSSPEWSTGVAQPGSEKSTGIHSDFVFAVIPGSAELDFKKLARAAQWRKAEMAPLKDVQPLTGYIRGGVTIFGAKKAFPVFVDETAILFDRISVSAGTRGTQLILAPGDYLRAAAALAAPVKAVDITKDTRPSSSEGRP